MKIKYLVKNKLAPSENFVNLLKKCHNSTLGSNQDFYLKRFFLSHAPNKFVLAKHNIEYLNECYSNINDPQQKSFFSSDLKPDKDFLDEVFESSEK